MGTRNQEKFRVQHANTRRLKNFAQIKFLLGVGHVNKVSSSKSDNNFISAPKLKMTIFTYSNRFSLMGLYA